jgi:prephenate dehydrogenase
MTAPRTVAVLGLGLMGGSLALALRRPAYGWRVRGWGRRAETRALALQLGALDEAVDSPAEAVRGAALVVLCAPVRGIPDLAAACRPGLEPGAVVTDVGSTKVWIEAECARALDGSGAVFVGSHPMAGSEQAGLDIARADLYDGATVAVTGAAGPAVEAVETLWSAAGARVVRMDAATHDEFAARISHAPHLAAALIVLAAARPGVERERLAEMIGPGFRDATRIAGGLPALWEDIVRTNPAPVLASLDALSGQVAAMRAAVAGGDWSAVRALLEAGRDARAALVPPADEPEAGA